MVPLCFYLFREKSLCGNKEVNIWYLPSLLSAMSFSFFCYLFSNVLTPQKTWDFVPAFSPFYPNYQISILLILQGATISRDS